MLTFVLFIYFCKAYCILRIHKVFPKILMSRCVVPWPQIKMSNTEHLGGKILSNNFMATTEARAGFRCQDEAPILKHTFEMPCKKKCQKTEKLFKGTSKNLKLKS